METKEFKAITTQEEFDSAIQARLERCKTTTTEEITKKYEGYISPDDFSKKEAESTKKINDLNAQLNAKDGSIADLTAKVKAYETSSVKMRVAHEVGLPYELADKLSGETEEEIKKDAETFAKFIKPKHEPAPLHSTDSGSHTNSKDAMLIKLNESLKGE